MITFDGVTKRYGRLPGRRELALRGLELRVRRGECVALVGPNGAGKSTAIGLALGFLRPDGGRVRVGGEEPARFLRSRGAAYLPERFSPPSHLRAEAVLRRLALLGGVARRETRGRARAALARVGLKDAREKRVRALSRGHRQRLGVAQLLLAPRRIVLLDEPWGGMDPEGKSRLRKIFADLRTERRGTAMLLASHDLGQVARVADRAVVLAGGRAAEEVPLRREGAEGLLEERVLARSALSWPAAGPGPERRARVPGASTA